MGTLASYTIEGYTCDAFGCPAVIRGAAMPYGSGSDYYMELAAAAGWTFWAARGLRAYCADHGPRPGHRMRRVPATRAERRAIAASVLRGVR